MYFFFTEFTELKLSLPPFIIFDLGKRMELGLEIAFNLTPFKKNVAIRGGCKF